MSTNTTNSTRNGFKAIPQVESSTFDMSQHQLRNRNIIEEQDLIGDETHELLCVDYSKNEKRTLYYYKRAIFCFACVVIIVILGSKYETWKANQVPSTLTLYQTPAVCVVTDETRSKFKTYQNDKTINKTKEKIVHCGECGACSNMNDISIYKNTTQTLYQTAKICTWRGFVGGRRGVKRCMQKRTTFTPQCLDCWAENMACDLRLCVFNCLRYSIRMMVDRFRNPGNHELNPCLKCDEMRCGPAFLKCAGANRRRCGIISDINRDVDHEVCKKVDL